MWLHPKQQNNKQNNARTDTLGLSMTGSNNGLRLSRRHFQYSFKCIFTQINQAHDMEYNLVHSPRLCSNVPFTLTCQLGNFFLLKRET